MENWTMHRFATTATLTLAMMLTSAAVPPRTLAQTEKPLVTPDSGGSIESFVPQGYRIFTSRLADLNGDGLTDAVLGIQMADDVEAYEHDRPLLILLRRPDGTYRLSGRSDKAIETAPIGPHGDGFGLDIRGRTVVLSHTEAGQGAGAEQEEFYRFQDAGWYLIGASDFQWNYDNTAGQGVACPELHLPVTVVCVELHHSFNYNTSIEEWRYTIAKVTTQPDEGAPTWSKLVRRSIPKRPLMALSDADPLAIDTELFKNRTGPP